MDNFLLNLVCTVSTFKIVEAPRLGKSNSESQSPHPVLVRLKKAQLKWNILDNASKLKNVTNLLIPMCT